MPIDFLVGLHPLVLFSGTALFAFLWGLQAAIGANVAYRRDLVWQTAFILGLLFSGILFVAYYSIRPLTKQGPVDAPNWLKFLGIKFSIVISAIALFLTLVMEVLSLLPPVFRVTAPWDVFTGIGAILSLLAILGFTCLGGYLGKRWYDLRPLEPKNSETIATS